MLKILKAISMCLLLVLAGCAASSPAARCRAANDPLDKTKTGALVGAAAATAPIAPLCFIPGFGWGICGATAVYGAITGGAFGAGADALEQDDGECDLGTTPVESATPPKPVKGKKK